MKESIIPEPLELSVVIPAYNEERRLPAYLAEILAYLEVQPFSFEVIIVDDGSQDSTAEMVERFAAENSKVHLIRLPQNRGKGYAVKTGMLKACGKLRLFADADGATPITELAGLKKAIDAGADVAVASRALRDDSHTVKTKFHRKLMGTAFNFIVRTLTVKGINDTQCGFKLFSAEAANSAFPLQRIQDFGFDVEVLYICQKKRYRIVEVPVNWTDIPGSKVKLLRDSLRMFKDVVKIRVNDWRGAYQDAQ
ncbi:MAG: dolichyl-phosphate beta-glucosyltransferase [Geobacteraceae bacterium]